MEFSKHCYFEYNVIKVVIWMSIVAIVADDISADLFFHGSAIHA